MVYTYKEVFEASKEYFCGNDLSAKVFVDKYALRDDLGNYVELTPHDMHDRLAREFAKIDVNYGENYIERYNVYRAALDRFARIVPGGSPMSAVGNVYQLMSASNCVVIASPQDSMGGIMDSGKEMAQLFKRRCGVGIDLSTLRPEGAHVNNAARTTTGAWSFADFYSYVTRMVGQSGRRGACMITLSVHHPDVMRFATMKHDLTKVTGANISLRLSNEFLNAVEHNEKYQVRWPVDSESPQIAYMIDAREVWETIVNSATETAEPGLLMWDSIISNLPAHSYDEFKTCSTNPCCVSSDTIIMTTEGPRKICELHNKPFKAVVNGKVYDAPNGSWISGTGDVYHLVTDAGYEVKLTADHLILTDKGWVKAKELTDHKIILHNHCDISPWAGQGSYGEGYLLGMLVGDGNFVGSDSNSTAEIKVWKKDLGGNGLIKESEKYASNLLLRSDWKGWRERPDYFVMSVGNKLPNKFGIVWGNKVVTQSIETSSYNFHCGFLRGYFDTDGHIEGSQDKGYSVRLGSSNYDNLIKVQIMLSHLGIKSVIRDLHDARQTLLPDGHGGKKLYNCKKAYRLIISSDSIAMFNKHIGFSHIEKAKKLQKIISTIDFYNVKFYTKLKSFQYLGKEEVWDAGVDEIHAFDANGLYLHNSEIALSAYDSCRLISINLTNYVKNAFEINATFDMVAFNNDVALAQQMADNLIDIELSLIDGIISACDIDDERMLWEKLKKAGINGRRTGVGTHGLGDCLAQLCLKYDSKDALVVVNDIYKNLRDQAYNTSIDLAEKRGAFPVYNLEKERNCEFIKRLPQNILDRMRVHGRRNIALLTQAPTGSIAIISKVGEFDRYNVSSGIEPVFRNSYIRRKKINSNDDNIKVDYVDAMGDSWQEFVVYHSNVANYFQKMGGVKLPDYFVTSDQIDWRKRIDIQGAEQVFIDHSISSTINLPKGTDANVVGTLYLSAWKQGLKGVTVYVDGSRDGVLVTDDPVVDKSGRPTKIVHTESPKRPKELCAEIHHATVKGVKWAVIIGLLHNEPYELFMGQSDKMGLLAKHKDGKLVKLKGGLYSLLDVTNNVLVDNLIEKANNDEIAWTTRMMSMSLRHGVPIEYLVAQLSKDGSVVDVNMVLGRLLRKYINKKNQNSESCPSCGSTGIIHENGCKHCGSCGWSGCM
jgi:ribonucleoside-diphosphate reductase alpha chain